MNNNELNNLVRGFINKNGAKPDPKNQAKVEKMLSGLNDKQVQKLKSVLSNPDKSQEILNSPAAQALIKKLMK
ncbi:MAG: hypothetical protein K6F88_00060 [Ruminococcus sp.]|nr:hypothetical protein [Ruminococcus sp.]